MKHFYNYQEHQIVKTYLDKPSFLSSGIQVPEILKYRLDYMLIFITSMTHLVY